MAIYKSQREGDIIVIYQTPRSETLGTCEPSWIDIPDDWLRMQVEGETFFLSPLGTIEVHILQD